MLRGPKTASSYDFQRKSKSDSADIVALISQKLRRKRVKAATIVSYCENLDRNGDYCVHKNDLLEILNHNLGDDSISQREMFHLVEFLSPEEQAEKGLISYRKFLDVFSESLSYSTSEKQHTERWHDRDDDEDPKWATRRGSVGEWLKKAACPAEVSNFRKFIACLEEYERCSGMKCIHKEDGFVVPLGPDLKASVSFYMK